MTKPTFQERLHGVLTSKVGTAFTDQLFTIRHLGDGRLGWGRYSEDMQHYALITDDSGVRLGEEIDSPATAIWLVGVYSHDGRDYSHCEQIVGLDAAIACAVKLLVSPHQHFRKWPRATVIE
jgi:hypothetical protein